MRKLKTHEQHVKEKYPDAQCIGVSTSANGPVSMYMIIGAKLGENYKPSKEEAWKNAYEKINADKPQTV